jgi:hypothetical protein
MSRREHSLHRCGVPGCPICLEGKAVCAVCGGQENSLTTECPGQRLHPGVLSQVREGRLNFINGRWAPMVVSGGPL